MEFELAVAPDHAGALSRLKPLAASRDGRPRNQPMKAIWRDSPDHALLHDGLTLTETRGLWQLERVVPDAQPWLPGQPPPVLAESTDLAALPGLPAPLAPLAAFEGRRTTSLHSLAGGSVTLTVLRGVLRAVTAEREAARIYLTGDEAAVKEMALLIATAVPATLPTVSLAGAGIALATGWTPPPRRSGAPRMPETVQAVAPALAHIMGHLLDVVLWHAQQLTDGPEAIHQMRVAVRRARSAVSTFRPAFGAQALEPMRAALRTLNTQLGPARDWDVFTGETLPAIHEAMPEDERLVRLLAAADRQRRHHRRTLEIWLHDPAFRLLTIELAAFIAGDAWRQGQEAGLPEAPMEPAMEPVMEPALEPAAEPAAGIAALPAPPPATSSGRDLDTFAAGVLQKRWKQLLAAGKGMEDLDVPSLHGVRLRAKRARYACEMFDTLYEGKGPHRFIRRLSVLQQRLGVLNDGAVATQLLAELGGPAGRHGYAAGVVTGFLAARSVRLRPRIAAAFAKFRRQDPYWS